jgi:hypothetical protein
MVELRICPGAPAAPGLAVEDGGLRFVKEWK